MRRCRWRGAGLFVFAALLPISWDVRAADPVLSKPVPPRLSLRWFPNPANSNKAFVEVSGLDGVALGAIRKLEWKPAQWQRLLSVHAEQGDLMADIGLPAMLGAYAVTADAVRFEPPFPLEPGVSYRATLFPGSVPAWNGSSVPISAVHQLPLRRTAPSTIITQVFPSASVLPENLLKFYIHFSAPMRRGHIYDHIHLRDAAGREIELPFLEIDEELWDPSMTRLTLFIDPGRIKRGVQPLEEIGPSLEAGHSYTLAIDREWKDAAGNELKDPFTKSFKVGPPDREPLNTATWRINRPAVGTRQPLTVGFPKPMDHALAQRVIRVSGDGGKSVDGQAKLEDHERRWTFVPIQEWRHGAHKITVETTLEDLAGNNIGKPFEVDLFEGIQRRLTNAVVTLPFDIR